MPSKNIVLLIFLFCSVSSIAQNSQENTRKIYQTRFTNEPPKIDGILDDPTWENVPAAKNFVMLEPGDGDPIPESHQTEVKLLYDNEAIYIAAYLYEENPERILNQYTQRDNLEQAEFFLIDLNTYDDGQNQTRFIVTSTGTQADAKMNADSEDYSYNVVWDSDVSHDENGWYVELKIPYAALRFPEKQQQEWGLQFGRTITHLNETYTWNYVNKAIGTASQQTGLLRGIENIDPPVRLSFYPFTQASIDSYDGTNQTNFSAGMDLKYGINESFTLDVTLVPDFGQAAYDEIELNLGPFEQVFGENRAFFTEGTELFNKGDLFYSRRVGGLPVGFNLAQTQRIANEEIIENPEKVDVLNALKVSGRTANGLGIGVFNAITNKTEAILRDTITGNTRNVITEPLSNYNILVLDQRFNKNSSISLINTNVTRDGNFRDGNVTGFLFDLFTRSNSFNFSGEAKMSNVHLPGQNVSGFASELSAQRTKGNFRYGISHEFANQTYDINDLGINQTNNYNNFNWETSYQIFEPQGNLNSYRISIYGQHLRRYDPDMEVTTGAGGSVFAITRNRFAFGGEINVNNEFRDFFEPRVENRFITYPKLGQISAFISPDYRKTFACDVRAGYTEYFDSPYYEYNISIEPRLRLSTKFNLIYEFAFDYQNERPSFVSRQNRDIIFGSRDQKSLENSINASYNFDSRKAINLSFRNFWSTAKFGEDSFATLEADGSLLSTNYPITGSNDPDRNFNIWNLDLSYRWQFAPGSEAVLLYRNSIFNLDNQAEIGYLDSFNNLFAQPSRHNLSLRIVYFLDYNQVRDIFQS